MIFSASPSPRNHAMSHSHIVVALLLLAPLAGFAAGQGRKPAPPASRWGYTL
jgi:hypothetical protein